ncbi:GNAT family N-acetyltransferase [Nocardioides fonticola]|uniref:GNAT family N-acetyltransferase n=1 Tax=Nocardioides fonticola TaxID=450363 RepID=A0ABP7Y4W0_9ACTN
MGKHLLGPHVVGQRVVVRRLLRGQTGPTGGPAFTDLLGTCLAWGEGRCVVQPETGPPVTIALADLVSGKPVPPRAAVHLRVTPVDAQRAAFALFPGLETEPLGSWTLRHHPHETARRANSVLAFGPAGDPLSAEEAIGSVVAWYAARGRRPIAAVLTGSPEAALLGESGWVPESTDADTLFRLAPVARARRALPRTLAAEAEVGIEGANDGEDGGLVRAWIPGPEGHLASGLLAVDGDWAGVRGMEVAAAHRGRGLALAVLATLLEVAAERGARTAYLQVLADNERALRLYDGLGFVDHHRYTYLAPPVGT